MRIGCTFGASIEPFTMANFIHGGGHNKRTIVDSVLSLSRLDSNNKIKRATYSIVDLFSSLSHNHVKKRREKTNINLDKRTIVSDMFIALFICVLYILCSCVPHSLSLLFVPKIAR